MQLYNINDLPDSIAKNELVSFANKTLSSRSGNMFHIKGRKDSTCANINNTVGGFVDGFGACELRLPCICQLNEVNRRNLS